jgi:cell division protein FtsZ
MPTNYTDNNRTDITINNNTMLEFDLPKEQSSIIKVIGVGGGGGNAVKHMHSLGIDGVDFVICNTDEQALANSPIYNKVYLGPEITKGLGAGSVPEVGRKATEESAQSIKDILNKKTEMVFITAGMGGGTGTGGAPVVAKIAKEMGILTVAIVTMPFAWEGKRKVEQAKIGLEQLRHFVDTIIIISNDKIREIYGNLKNSEAFAHADSIVAVAARSISDIVTQSGNVNIDFADVKYTMENGGTAIMGTSTMAGADRAHLATMNALNSPLLNNNTIKGAQKVLINISSSSEYEVTMDEIDEITTTARAAAENDLDVIYGACLDEELGEYISITIIATGFQPIIDETPNLFMKPVETKKVDATPVVEVIDLFSMNDEVKEVDSNITFINSGPLMEITNLDKISEKEELAVQDGFRIYDSTEESKIEYVAPPITYTNPNIIQKSERELLELEALERRQYLKDLSYDYSNPNVMKELEDVPAFVRANKTLDPIEPSNVNEQAKYNLKQNENGDLTLGKNTFIFDNPC